MNNPMRFLAALVMLSVALGLGAQTSLADPTLESLDNATKTLATQLATAIAGAKNGSAQAKVAVGAFLYQGNLSPLGELWTNNLVSGLVESGNRALVILSAPANQDFLVQGEIVSLGETIRIYTKVLRTADSSLVFSRHHDLGYNAIISGLLETGRGPVLARDAWESNDSQEEAKPLQLTATGGSIQANFHNDSDEDWYRLTVPSTQQLLRIQTTGDVDTIMELYDRYGEFIQENDDGGEDYNAKIQARLTAGDYFISIRNYDEVSGPYGLEISYVEPPSPDSYEPDNTSDRAKTIAVNATPQRRSLHLLEDEDWIRLDITRRAVYVIRAQPEDDSSLDTYLELYNSQLSMINSDDDGGDNLGSMLEEELQPGTYYVKVYSINEEEISEAVYMFSVANP